MNDWLQLLGLINRAKRLVTGEDNILTGIRTGCIHLVIIAGDASENTKKKYQDKCAYYGVKCLVYGSSAEISQAIGKINRVAIGISDRGFSQGLLAKISK